MPRSAIRAVCCTLSNKLCCVGHAAYVLQIAVSVLFIHSHVYCRCCGKTVCFRQPDAEFRLYIFNLLPFDIILALSVSLLLLHFNCLERLAFQELDVVMIRGWQMLRKRGEVVAVIKL